MTPILHHRRSRAATAIALLGLVATLSGCGSDMLTEPEGPGGPGLEPIFLEDSELLPGRSGILLSTAFSRLELEPARDEDGVTIPGRWTNFVVTIDDEAVDSRRLDATRIEFDVPVRPAGDVTLRVETPGVVSVTTARVRGLLASRRVDDCAANDFTTLIPVGREIVLSLFCPVAEGSGEGRLGYAAVDPAVEDPSLAWIDGLYVDRRPGDGTRAAVIHPGPSTRSSSFVARRPGPTTEPLDMWRWEHETGGSSGPVEPLTCFPEESGDDVNSAVADLDGACVAFQAGFLRRDGVAIAECCSANAGVTFVLSSDGSAALRHVRDLVVFDPDGRIVFRLPYGRIIDDVAFSRDGDRLYVAVASDGGGEGDAGSGVGAASILDVRDRRTAELLDRIELEGRVGALAVAGDRLWLTREPSAGPFAVDLYAAATLEHRRTILIPRTALVPSQDQLTGALAVLRQNAEGTRLHLTSVVGGIVRSDVIEVF